MDIKNAESNPSSEVTNPHLYPIPRHPVSQDTNPTLLKIPAAPKPQESTKPNFFSRLKNKILPK